MRYPLVLLLSSLVTLGAAGCRSAPESNPLELHTYDVPKGTVRALVTTLKDAMWLNETQSNIGRATVTPDGRLAVLAPRNVQANVQELVDEVAKHPPQWDNTVELRYWLVVAKPASSPQPPPPGAEEIQPALDEIARTVGPQEFKIAQAFRLASLLDEHSELKGDGLRVSQHAVETTDGVYARVELEYQQHNRLDTQVHLLPDKIVVLGAAGQKGGDAPDGSTLYYVVKAAPSGDGKKP